MLHLRAMELLKGRTEKHHLLFVCPFVRLQENTIYYLCVRLSDCRKHHLLFVCPFVRLQRNTIYYCVSVCQIADRETPSTIVCPFVRLQRNTIYYLCVRLSDCRETPATINFVCPFVRLQIEKYHLLFVSVCQTVEKHQLLLILCVRLSDCRETPSTICVCLSDCRETPATTRGYLFQIVASVLPVHIGLEQCFSTFLASQPKMSDCNLSATPAS